MKEIKLKSDDKINIVLSNKVLELVYPKYLSNCVHLNADEKSVYFKIYNYPILIERNEWLHPTIFDYFLLSKLCRKSEDELNTLLSKFCELGLMEIIIGEETIIKLNN